MAQNVVFPDEIPGKILLPAEYTDAPFKRTTVIDEHALVTFDAVAAILLHPTYAQEATAHASKSFRACAGFHGDRQVYTLSGFSAGKHVLYFSRLGFRQFS